MASGRKRGAKASSGRDPGGFVALPWSVLDCPAYANLSHPGRSLLLEIARQYVRDNNGRLLASRAHLATRGWKSADVIQRAKDELLAARFIHETVKGHRPNKASWYAITWQPLDHIAGYDAGAAETFVRSAYRKNTPLCPPGGTERLSRGPSDGTGQPSTVPPRGAIEHIISRLPVPSDGHHLDMPSDVHPASQAGRQSEPGSTPGTLASANALDIS
jgi:hypothetical protein